MGSVYGVFWFFMIGRLVIHFMIGLVTGKSA